MKIMINTAQGPKSSGEALEIFKRAKLPAGSLLGIFTQLQEHDPERAREAAEFVNRNGGKFSEKIQRMAKEQSTSRPIGAKRVQSCEQVEEMLTTAGTRSRWEITFRADTARQAIEVVSLVNRRLIQFDDTNATMFIMNAVVPSGRWEFIPRTYTITVQAVSEHEYREIARAFGITIESLRLHSSMIERVSVLHNGIIDDILTKRNDLFYDESVFRATCVKLNRLSEAAGWISEIKDINAPFGEILTVIPMMPRLAFLEKYVECFDTAMATA
jgi:hypothetical protein